MFYANFSGHNKIWKGTKNLGELPLMTPLPGLRGCLSLEPALRLFVQNVSQVLFYILQNCAPNRVAYMSLIKPLKEYFQIMTTAGLKVFYKPRVTGILKTY